MTTKAALILGGVALLIVGIVLHAFWALFVGALLVGIALFT